MPTYEYACPACKAEWEADQRITDPPIVLCPACGELEARRLISGTTGKGFELRGKGWARDGYSKR